MTINAHDLVDLVSTWLWSFLLVVMMFCTAARVTIWLVASVRDTWRKSFPRPDAPKLEPWPPPPVTEGHTKRSGTNPAPTTAKPRGFSPPGQGGREWTGPAEDMR